MSRPLLVAGTLVGLSALAALAAPGASAEEAIHSVAVAGTAFRVTLADGRVLTGPDLAGVVLTLGDPAHQQARLRIDAVEPDPADPGGEITLYAFSVEDPATGQWSNPCSPDPDGRRLGFPLAGTWTATGEHLTAAGGVFSLTCTSGASGKCVRMGYKPWATATDGTPLWDHHQACVRMLRADYCGDGRAFTRDGTLIDLYDGLGIQRDEPEPGMTFEAGWGPAGAVCVAHTRIPELLSLDGLAETCPRLQSALLGPNCREDTAAGALLFNKSF